MLTVDEFDLIVKTVVIVGAWFLALNLCALPWVLDWRRDAHAHRRRGDDLMLLADACRDFGPEQERIP